MNFYRKEVDAIRGTTYLKATLASCVMISRLAIFVSLVTYIFLGNVITAQKVFIVFSYFNILKMSMMNYWPRALISVAEGYISVKRIQDFLLDSEKKQKVQKSSFQTLENGMFRFKRENSVNLPPKRVLELKGQRKGIVIRNMTAAWKSSGKEAGGVFDLNLVIPDGELCCVVGPVAAGKSTLLHVILGELNSTRGECIINGTMSYASQTPWLFEGTVRSNIIFVDEFHQKRYEEVVRVCGLERDFKLMPNGDQTIVGERGISLSGGQKARISLARAVYKRADIYLLDDPLSAVDSHVGKHIFRECIQRFLKDKICILVTHQLQYLKDVSHLVLMYRGQIESQGSYAQVQQESAESFLTIESIDETGTDEETNRKVSF